MDIYSGRDNPSWQLDGETHDELIEAIDQLRQGNAQPLEPGLGFRGLLVSSLTTTWRSHARVRVVPGLVVIGAESDDPILLADEDSTVLALLFEDAKTHLDRQTLDQLPEIGD